MNANKPIDFVILWVDGADPAWKEKKEKYLGRQESKGGTQERYRDWGILKYWFRGVDKFAPWVRNVYFITDNQKPEWLNLNHPKLKWVKHTDFMPLEYLPTFNSNPIELNLHRIKDLADQFVYFNDDMLLIHAVKPEDFFVKGKPCDFPKLGVLFPEGLFTNILFNNARLLNRHFSLKKSIRNNWRKWIMHQNISGLFRLLLFGCREHVSNSVCPHIHLNLKKDTLKELWDQEYEELHAACFNKQRTKDDLSIWCARDWQILSGEFFPKKPMGKAFGISSMDKNDEMIDYLLQRKGKIICLNDDEAGIDYALFKSKILQALETVLPCKSSFEI